MQRLVHGNVHYHRALLFHPLQLSQFIRVVGFQILLLPVPDEVHSGEHRPSGSTETKSQT